MYIPIYYAVVKLCWVSIIKCTCSDRLTKLFVTLSDLESNNSLSRLAWEAQGISTSETFRLENFTYNNDVIMNTVFGHMAQTNFRGVTVS